MPTAVELAPGQVVPPAVGADLDDVAGELVVRRAEALELARVDDAAPVGLAQLLAVDVRHEAHVVRRRTPGTRRRRRLPDVAGGPQQLGVRVADVETGERAAAEVAETARRASA